MTGRPEDIAIVGMACLFPGAEGPAEFWSNICRGLEMIRDPLPSWDPGRYLDGTEITRIPTAKGGFLGEQFGADPVSMGVMPSSIDGSEPDHFLALRIAQAALEDALQGRDFDPVRTGIILGHSTYLHRGNAAVVQHGVVLDQTRAILGQLMPEADPAVLDRVRKAMEKALPPFNSDTAPGLVPNVMTGRIANRLDLRGPNYILDAACASSLLSVQSAMVELRAGRSDLMLAGGVNASISAEVYMVFAQLGALSSKGRVRPFAEGGDGTLLGEGLGMLALKRRSDAEADGDRIYALLKGVGQSSDGKGSGLLAPRLEGEILAIERAYQDAGEAPLAPGLVEAHGTGIALGDRTEITALRSVFGDRAADGLPRTALGAVKSMIGHCIPAAGAAGLIKTALALYHRTLPPTLAEAVRDGLPVAETPLYLNTRARPWIAAPPEMGGAPRRAAVNAFGFGGINSHAVLEETGAAVPPAHWPEELVLLSAGTPAELAARARDLAGRVAAHDMASLSAIAAHAAATSGRGRCRLALVATSRAALLEKLDKAAERLEAGKASFRTRSGLFASDRPIGGKLAFLFPGEGAQYQNMLADLLIAFPEARDWFDFWEGLFPDRAYPPSASAFPPPTTLAPDLAERLKARLFGLELGSESVFFAAQALLAVTRKLGIEADVLVGHSSGEHSALSAAGVFGPMEGAAARADFAARIRTLNRLYHEMEGAGDIPGGALLTVGGVERAAILALVEADETLHLALDNCQHQAVLYGPRATLEKVADRLRPQGGMSAFLPFDRPYHTPLFAPVAEKVAGVYRDIGFRAPQVPVWSCATAAPMPQDPAAVMDLAVTQWKSRVRFLETVEALHDDGARVFLEVGPSANLTGFVEDALKGREHLALALDSRRRGGLSHFLQSLGRLWVAGRDFDVAALFAGRVAAADLEAGPARKKTRFIDNTLPFIRLPEEEAAELAAALRAPVAAPSAGGAAGVSHPRTPVGYLQQDEGAEAGAAAAAGPAPEAPPGAAPEAELGTGPAAAPGAGMGGYFATMDRFLSMQGNVMAAALGGAPEAEAGEWQPPLLHRVLARDEARLVAELDCDPVSDPFIAQHVLYADAVSDLDPDLQALPVLPMAVSFEIALEAATLLTGEVPNALENLRARDWVAFDDGPETLGVEADLLAPGRCRVVLKRGAQPLFEAETVCDGQVAGAPVPPLAAPRAPVWEDHQLYTTGMFHGPLFQGVGRLLAWDETGLDAELADMPLDGFFAGEAPGGLLLNPALLDQLGHVTAFWIAQGLGTDFSSFPSSIARIDLPQARGEATAGAVLQGRTRFLDAQGAPQAGPAGSTFLEGDFDCTAPDGTLLMCARGWRDRFFAVPNRFYEARYRPREAWYGAPAEALFEGVPGDMLVWSVPAFDEAFLTDAGGIWLRVLATTVLSRAERAQWRQMKGPPKRRRDWLMGRIAVKEAARGWLLQQHGVALLPADIETIPAETGKPFVNPAPLEAFGLPAPEISLAHTGGAAVAAAAPPGRPVGIDMETLAGLDPALLANGAFSAEERALLGPDPAGLLAGWCAKEAAAKLLGSGLTGRPKGFTIARLDAAGAEVLTPQAGACHVALARQGGTVLALALSAG
jgi:acyl transferase domain-containing protein/phosphopantetheinyl transferase